MFIRSTYLTSKLVICVCKLIIFICKFTRMTGDWAVYHKKFNVIAGPTELTKVLAGYQQGKLLQVSARKTNLRCKSRRILTCVTWTCRG
mmetsp:Transcript_15985/g.35979  ORF Transcript_15985/g.35979 Transcript_15985/m.35979 type:complete len:89 (-) Transcript_15985:2312-2578(-)